jgi:hypothetical protein
MSSNLLQADFPVESPVVDAKIAQQESCLQNIAMHYTISITILFN